MFLQIAVPSTLPLEQTFGGLYETLVVTRYCKNYLKICKNMELQESRSQAWGQKGNQKAPEDEGKSLTLTGCPCLCKRVRVAALSEE